MHDPDCIFCRILRQEIPAEVIDEDGHSFVFMDINPLADGHIMVIPKVHVQHVHDLEPADAQGLFATVHTVAGALRLATDADALSIGINDGVAAGQVVPHVHVHLVPRWKGDGGGHLHSQFERARGATRERAEIRAAIVRELRG